MGPLNNSFSFSRSQSWPGAKPSSSKFSSPTMPDISAEKKAVVSAFSKGCLKVKGYALLFFGQCLLWVAPKLVGAKDLWDFSEDSAVRRKVGSWCASKGLELRIEGYACFGKIHGQTMKEKISGSISKFFE